MEALLAQKASNFVADLFAACLHVGRADEDQRAGGWNGGRPETDYGRKTAELVNALLARRENRRKQGLTPESSKVARRYNAHIRKLDEERIQLLVDEGIDPGTLGRRWRGQQQRLAALRVTSNNPCSEVFVPLSQRYFEGRRG